MFSIRKSILCAASLCLLSGCSTASLGDNVYYAFGETLDCMPLSFQHCDLFGKPKVTKRGGYHKPAFENHFYRNYKPQKPRVPSKVWRDH